MSAFPMFGQRLHVGLQLFRPRCGLRNQPVCSGIFRNRGGQFAVDVIIASTDFVYKSIDGNIASTNYKTVSFDGNYPSLDKYI